MRSEILCPQCSHPLDLAPGKKQAVLLYCFVCEGKNRKELAVLARTLTPEAVRQCRPRPPRVEWSEDQLRENLTIAQRNLERDRGAQAFLATRGIDLATARTFGLGCCELYGENRVCLPYRAGPFAEEILQLRYRRIAERPTKKMKWCCQKRNLGGRRLFNLMLLENWDAEAMTPLIITESELDAMTLTGLGANAISVDSAGHRLLEPDRVFLRKVRRLYLAFDADAAGWECTKRFKAALPGAKVLGGLGPEPYGPGKKDIGEMWQADPAAFAERLHKFLERGKQQ